MILIKVIVNHWELSSDPEKAKERLVKDGIEFITWDGEPDASDEDYLTYYVVSLTYEAQRVSASA